MATPFTNVGGDPNRAAEDNYNFFHLQLRIWVECAFGMLVQRWGILRMAMPRNVSISKVVCICLHGDCIGKAAQFLHRRIRCTRAASNSTIAGARQVSHDECKRWLCWFAQWQSWTTSSAVVPTDLLHLGEYFSDIPESFIRHQRQQMAQIILPRTVLFEMIADGHWKRPTSRIK